VPARQLDGGLVEEEWRDEGKSRSKIVSLVGTTQPEASQPGAHRSLAVRKASVAVGCSASMAAREAQLPLHWRLG